jgi:ribosomal protein L40E
MVQRAADESWDDLVRCPTCGGLNALDAEWCGQCNRRFRAAGRRSRTEPATDGPSYVEALAGLLVGPEGVPEGGMERVFRLDGESSAWVCAGCAAETQLEATRCRQCGRPFAERRFKRSSSRSGGRTAISGSAPPSRRCVTSHWPPKPDLSPFRSWEWWCWWALLKAAARLIARRSR